MKFLLIFLGVFIFLGMITYSMLAGTYNSLVGEREQARTQYSDIEVQLKRRSDLVPNVVGATKGAMAQERAVFEDIAKAHAAFQKAPSGSAEQMDAGNALGVALRGWMVVAQQYPDLKSLDIVKGLITEIEGTENRISVARQRYNADVLVYNRHLQTFPTNVLGGMYGFELMPRYEIDEESKKAPSVNLDFENQ